MNDPAPNLAPEPLPGTPREWREVAQSVPGRYLLGTLTDLQAFYVNVLATEAEPMVLYRTQGKLQQVEAILDDFETGAKERANDDASDSNN